MQPDPERRGVTVDISVRFAETDQMGVVHHGAYAAWLEVGRIAWLDVAGAPYVQMAARGYNFAVTSLSVQYRTPARFGDTVRVITRLDALRTRQISFSYEVRNSATCALLALAATAHVCVDEHGHTVRLPADLIAQLQSGSERLTTQTQSDGTLRTTEF